MSILERSSKLLYNLAHFSYGFSVALTYFCPWTLYLNIVIVLFRLRVHFLVEIKRYKSRIRVRIVGSQICDYENVAKKIKIIRNTCPETDIVYIEDIKEILCVRDMRYFE